MKKQLFTQKTFNQFLQTPPNLKTPSKLTWIDLFIDSMADVPEYMFAKIQKDADIDILKMRNISPRNISKMVRLEQFEKIDDKYVMNLTWLGDTSKFSNDLYELLEKILQELCEDMIWNAASNISFLLKYQSEIQINLESKSSVICLYGI